MTSERVLPRSRSLAAALALILSLMAPIQTGLHRRRAPGKIAAALIPEVITSISYGSGAPGPIRLPSGGP